MKHVTLELHLSSLKFGLDPMGSLLGANLIHLPRLVRIVLGILDIMKLIQYDLQPVTLTFDPMGVTSRAEPNTQTKFGRDRARGHRDIEDVLI